MEQTQRQRRIQRARQERFEIEPLRGEHLERPYAVKTASGRVYEVDVPSIRDRLALCECLDSRTNTLGTCKHAEAVWIHLENLDPEGFREARERGPREGRIYLERGPKIQVRVLAPEPMPPDLEEICEIYFDREGTFRGQLWRDFGGLVRSLGGRQDLTIEAEVHAHVHHLRARAKRDHQLRQARARVLDGERLHTLRTPLPVEDCLSSLHLALRQRAILAQPPGTGMERVALGAAEWVRREEGIERIAIVTSRPKLPAWRSWIQDLCQETPQVAQGTPKDRQRNYRRRAVYTLLPEDVLEPDLLELRGLVPELLIYDGADSIENWKSPVPAQLREIDPDSLYLLLEEPPLSNLDRLYALVSCLEEGRLGPLWRFNPRYFILGEDHQVHGTKNLPELEARLTDLIRVHDPRRESPPRIEDDLPPQVIPTEFRVQQTLQDELEDLRGQKRRTQRYFERLRDLIDTTQEGRSEDRRQAWITSYLRRWLSWKPGRIEVLVSDPRRRRRLVQAQEALPSPVPECVHFPEKLEPFSEVEDLERVFLFADPPRSAAEAQARRALRKSSVCQQVLSGAGLELARFRLADEHPEVFERLHLDSMVKAPERSSKRNEDWEKLFELALQNPQESGLVAPASKALPLLDASPRRPPPRPLPPRTRTTPEATSPTLGPSAPSPEQPEALRKLTEILTPTLGRRFRGLRSFRGQPVVLVDEDLRKVRGTIRAICRGLALDPWILDPAGFEDLQRRPLGLPESSPDRDWRAQKLVEEARDRFDSAQALIGAGLARQALSPAYRSLCSLLHAKMLEGGHDLDEEMPLIPQVQDRLVRTGSLSMRCADILARLEDLLHESEKDPEFPVDRPRVRSLLGDLEPWLQKTQGVA